MKNVRMILLPALAITVVCAIVAGIIEGGDGVLGALLGGVLVSLFMGSTPAVLGATNATGIKLSAPMATSMVLTKLVAAAALLLLLFDVGGIATHVHFGSLGMTAIIVALIWTVLQIRAFPRQRVPTYDLDSDA